MQPPAERPVAGPGAEVDEHAAMRPRDFGLVVLGAVLWGTGGLAGATLASDGIGMLAVASARLAVGGGALLAVVALAGRMGRWSASRPARRRVLVTGLLAALYQSCYFLAVSWTSVSVATLVALGAAPVLVASATAVRRRRAPGRRTVLAVVLALAGLVLLVGVSGSGSPAGVGLALVAAAAFATLTVVNRSPVAGLDPLTLTGASFTLGALLLAPVAVVTALAAVPAAARGGPTGDLLAAVLPTLVPAGASAWLLVAYLGVGPTALAYGAYFAGLRSVPATTASLLALLEPLTAALGAALLRDERLGPAGLLGAALLATAVVVLRPRRRSPTMVAGLP